MSSETPSSTSNATDTAVVSNAYVTTIVDTDINVTRHAVFDHDYMWLNKETTLTDIAFTPVTAVLDVRPCDIVTIHTRILSGAVKAYLRCSIDQPKAEQDPDNPRSEERQNTGDANPSEWYNYKEYRFTGHDTLFERLISIDVMKLGISFLRLDAQKVSDGDAIVKTHYRGNIHHSKFYGEGYRYFG